MGVIKGGGEFFLWGNWERIDEYLVIKVLIYRIYVLDIRRIIQEFDKSVKFGDFKEILIER